MSALVSAPSPRALTLAATAEAACSRPYPRLTRAEIASFAVLEAPIASPPETLSIAGECSEFDRLVFQFRDDAGGKLGTHARRLGDRRLVLQCDGGAEFRRRQNRENGQGHLGANALNVLQQPKPITFRVRQKAEQPD